MKKILLSTFVICSLFGFQACNLDNYDMPSATFSGSLVDYETNENVPCEYQNGSRIRMYEFYNNGWSNQPYDFYTRQDGTFINTSVFPGKYQILVEGPFENTERLEVQISKSETLEIKVIPLLRISADVTVGDRTAEISTKVRRTSSKRVIKAVEFYCSETPYVDKNSFSEKKSVDLSNLTDEEISSTTFTGKFIELQKNKTYYLRVGALAENPSNYYNYSKVIKVEIP